MQDSTALQNSIYRLLDKGNSVLFRWRNDAHWSIEYVSKNVFNLLGYTQEEFLQQKITYADCLHPDIAQRVKKEVMLNMHSKDDFFEHRPYIVVTKENKEKWITDQTILERDEEGNVTHFVGPISDISQSMELRYENERLLQRVDLAIESTEDGIWDWNLQTDEAYFSPNWKKMLGYEDKELPSTPEAFFDLIHPGDQNRVKNAIEAHLKNPKEPYLVEIRFLCKDGSYKWILARGRASFDSSGAPLRMVGSHVDISKTKELEERLQLLNQRFTQMFQTHKSIMLLINPKTGAIIDANESAQKFYGYTYQEFKKLNIAQINCAPQETLDKNREDVIQGQKNNFEFTHKKKSGEIAIVNAKVSAIESDEGRMLFSIVSDITKEKENEESLQKLLFQLKEAQKIAKIGFLEFEHQTQKLSWSDEIFSILEIKKEEFDNSYIPFVERIHPEDLEHFNAAYYDSLESKKMHEVSFRVLMPSGEVKYLLQRFQSLFDANAQVKTTRATIQDITELKLLDEKVSIEGRRLRAFMDGASDGIFIINRDLELVDYSKVAKDMLGYSDKEMKKLRIPDWDNSMSESDLQEHFETLDENPIMLETVHKRKDNTSYIASISAAAVNIDGEKLLLASVRDVSELKELQEKLLYEKNFVSTIVESANAVIVVIDHTGRMIKLNSYAEEFTGYTQEEIAQEPYMWKKFVSEDIHEDLFSLIEDAKNGHIVANYQNPWHSKSGEVRMFEWSNTLVKKEDGSMDYLVSIGIDITQNEEQKAFLKLLMNSQSHLILLADGTQIKYLNQATLEFYGFESLEEMQKSYDCICETFIEDDDYFHMAKVPDGMHWSEAVRRLPPEKQMVCIYSKKDKQTHVFKINIELYVQTNVYIITLVDISDTIKKQLELEYQNHHDTLTQAFNRAYFNKYSKTIFKIHERNGELSAIAMIDIDHFKSVNDTHGHDVGDIVLQNLVKVIHSNSRESDTLIRWGGEEFLLILPVKEKEKLQKILDALREKIQDFKMPSIGNITVSIGASFHTQARSFEESIKKADENLYISKNSGRNRVTIH